ncbi:hypothetical protein NG99_01245 [Erwinia typographi]|uniref:DUF6945 domain-containing protein n=1 Tax=Erwinia typographi TaxID=371042 RepID=A0A0A3ZDQ4_9GAMM|nr:hypothetical protein [Erwinia typographi]KGT95796.1 hypothetical protein NG99_01245 [Erwinia typographi]
MAEKNNPLEVDIFYKLPKILFNHNTIINTQTGEVVELNVSDIVLYSYMLDQYTSYKKSGNDFFESTQSIADKCSHLSDKTIRRSLVRLKSAGLIEVGKKSTSGQWASNLYTVYSVDELLRTGHIALPEAVEPEEAEVISPEPVVITAEPAAMPTPEEGLSQYFLKYFAAGQLSKCLDFTAAMTEFKKLIDAERGTSVNIPLGFTEHLILNHPHVYDSWGIPF